MDKKCPKCGRSLAGQVEFFYHGELICGDCFFKKTGLERVSPEC